MRRTPAAGAAVAELVLGRGLDVVAVEDAVGAGSLETGAAAVAGAVIAGVPRAAVVVTGAVVGAAPEQAVTSSVSAAHAAYRRVCR